MEEDNARHIVRVYVGSLSQDYEALSVEASKHTTAEEIVTCIVQKLGFPNGGDYELAEVVGNSTGQECKERRIGPYESPVALKLLWPKALDAADSLVSQSASPWSPSSLDSSFTGGSDQYRFCLREKLTDSLWTENFAMDPQIIRDYFYRFLYQPKDKEYPDLCQLPDLNEQTLLENLKSRFIAGHIYSYVGSILIAVNPFKFHPIYNPKYVKLYQNRRREELPPHIFAIADSAYHTMLKEKRNQCIVISGESGSGKTESTNFLLHHLTALSQKGTHGSGVEQTILSAGPVLEAFGNAKTAHNNNSSRFGKFIQVSYRENGMVHGAIVQKYLLEKSRICCQAKNERNYHVFYYLLAGASDTEREMLSLLPPHHYHYLNQSGCYTLEGVDESYEFSRLKQSMEMVGFGADKQRKLFQVLSAVLLLGNVEFLPKKSSYHHDESILVKNPEVVRQISSLLRVTEETLLAALISKRARVSGEMLVINYRMPEAIAARDAMAKCLYGALFDWIVLQVNHALLSKKDLSGAEYFGKSIGVLDIFGFEDFDSCNSFEQFCINYANEHLQHYFNLHVFKYEQEEYKKEAIRWTNIGFMDNTACLNLFEGKPSGLICLLDDQSNFPGATNETLLQKFNSVYKEHEFYQVPQKREAAFIIRHYAGKVKYQVKEFREKNMDLMRHDIVSVLKNSSLAFVRELVGIDPVAVFRWAILRAFFRAYFAFCESGQRCRAAKARSMLNRAFSSPGRRRSSGNDHLVNDEVWESSGFDPYIQQAVLTDADDLKYSKGIRRLHSKSRMCYRPYSALSPHSEHCIGSNGSDCARNGCDSFAPERNGIAPCCYSSQNFGLHSVGMYSYYVKTRSFRTHPTVTRGMKNLQSVKTLASQTSAMGISNKNFNSRKQPISVSTQFQQSLHCLMITLNQANPFFIRCIKSNSDKFPNSFDDELVQRQLRYTGMLETVRIRQAGYNVRLAFEEFVHLYRILLPRGLNSNRRDVENFLSCLNLNRVNYQMGDSKIFLRESEKIRLDYFLHQQIMASIVRIQRWYRTVLERRHFLHVQKAVIKIQSFVRMFLAQRFVANLRIKILAATYIQKVWRGYKVRQWFHNFIANCVQFQAHVRGNMLRQRYYHIMDRHRRLHKQREKVHNVLRIKGDGDSHSGQSTDEAFISKGSSQEELDENRLKIPEDLGDSDESSGVHEDSETESVPCDATSEQGPRALRTPQSAKSLSSMSEMSTLALNLTSTPFSLPSVGSQSFLRSKSPSGTYKRIESTGRNSSQVQLPEIKERLNKQKVSIRSRKEKGSGKFGEEDFIRTMDEDDIGSLEFASLKAEDSSKNPFHRAKKHFKTLIIGSNKTKLEKHEAVLLDSESESEIAGGKSVTKIPASVESDTNVSSKSPSHLNSKNTRMTLESRLSEGVSHHPGGGNSALRQTQSLVSSSTTVPSDPKSDRGRVLVEHNSRGNHNQFLYRKVDTSVSSGRSRHDGKEERKRLIAERELTRLSLLSGGGNSSTTQGDTEQEMMEIDQETRRGSRESNQSIGSHSSQDSLFETRAALRREVDVASNVSSSFARPGTIPPKRSEVSTSYSVLAAGSQRLGDGENLSGQDFNARDVRRTRSVSENRKNGASTHEFVADDSPSIYSHEEFRSDVSVEGSISVGPTKTGYHMLDKVNKFHRGDICSACRKNMHVLFAPGLKCCACKLFYHSKCVQNGMVYEHPCRSRGVSAVDIHGNDDIGPSKSNTISRRKGRKQSKSKTDMSKPGQFSLTGTSEFMDRTDQIISGVRELQMMQEFISKKIYQVRHKEREKENAVDRVFQQALREFKESLVSTFSVASKQGGTMPLNIKYKDLIANFANIMETVCKAEGTGDDFPTTMGVNAFRGFLNEFMNSHRPEEKPKVAKPGKSRRKEKGNKRQKVEETINFLGHSFITMVINIPTACEVCSSFIMWPIERGVVCQKCKLACHKKCHLKIMGECNEGHGRSNSSSGSEMGVFGAPLRKLVPENGTVPIVVDQLVTAIEFYGLRLEGLYRKSGVSSRVRELKQHIEDGKNIDWSFYPPHVLTSVLKSFFRDMPEPLLTYELYDEFLRAADLSQSEERVHTIFAILKKLPKPNYDLMERLVFHLVRVAMYEDKNRMNANSLAIVFAPCILRTNKARQVQDSLSDIGRQTLCIETILLEQSKKVKETFHNIESVDSATHSFSVRLNSIRSSKMRTPLEKKMPGGSTGSLSEGSGGPTHESSTPESMSAEEEEEFLTRHIRHLRDEKAMLTSVLPSLSRTPSDEDMLSTDPEVDSPVGSIDNLHHEPKSPSPRQTRAQSLQYSKSDALLVDPRVQRLSPTLRLPGGSPLLHGLIKNRGPVRKPPSRFVRNLASVDFGEADHEEESLPVAGEDESVLSVDPDGQEDAILV